MNFFSKLFGSSPGTGLSGIMKEGAILVDVRTPGEFAQRSVKGAVNIPLEMITRKVSTLGGHKHIVVFCRSGNRSNHARKMLEQLGFRNVVDGGTWQDVQHALAQSK